MAINNIVLNGTEHSIGGTGDGMTAEFKSALETLLTNVVFKGDDPTGRTYLNALHTAMYPPANLTSISAVYTQSGTVSIDDSLESLKPDLVVTARYSNGTTEIVSSYTLTGNLTAGTSIITVAYGGKTTTFSVTVIDPTALPAEYQKVEWVGVENTGTKPTAYLYAGQVIEENSSLYIESKMFSKIGESGNPTCGTLGSTDNNLVSWQLRYTSDSEMNLYSVAKGTARSLPTLTSYTIGETWDTAEISFGSGSDMNILCYRPDNYPFNGKIKTLRLYNSNGQLTHNYVPCYRKADGVIGMYDANTGTFLTNAGSGTLSKGSNV